MTPHVSDELPRLLKGEASRDEVLAAAAHLRTCVDCQQELVSAVVAHASLSSALRFAPEIVAPDSSPNQPPTTAARGGTAASPSEPAAEATPAERSAEAAPAERPVPVPPDLSAVFAEVRAEAAAEGSGAARRSRVRYLVGAAAAVVAIGVGTGVWVASSGGDGGSPSGRTIALRAFGVGTTTATATIQANTIRVSAPSLPQLPNRRYEVWMTNTERTRMQPIGWIGNGDTTTLNVPSALMNRYQDLEVSVQNVDAKDYTYSGTSVLRGSLQ